MAASIVSIILTAFLVISPGSTYALEPVLVEGPDHAWRSVLGGVDGNPVVSFKGDLTGGRSIRGKFTDVPAWIVSEDFDGDGVSEAAIQFTDGTLRIVSLFKGNIRTISTVRKMSPAVSPVVIASLDGDSTGGLVGIDERGELVAIDYETGSTRRITSGLSTLSHPTAADLDGDGYKEIAAINDEGQMTIIKGRAQTRSSKNVILLPDSRITAADMDGDGQLEIAALSLPTRNFSPGRLGDDLEAQGFAVFEWNGRTVSLDANFNLPDGQIFEMLTPVLAGDAEEEDVLLMLVVTKKGEGSQMRSYSLKNGRVVEKRKGPVSGEDTWIHILGSTVLDDSEGVYLMTSLATKNDGEDLELYSLDLSQVRATLRSTVVTHAPGTRLLELALAGDFDRDGAAELMVAGEEGSSLEIYSFERNQLKGKEIFNSSKKIGTNLCPGDFNGDGISDVMFGLEDGFLVILLGE